VNQVIATAVLTAATLLIFGRVRADYLTHGSLTPLSSFLEVLIFFLHGSASYLFLDSQLAHVNTGSAAFVLSIVLIAVGLLAVLVPMSRLGFDTSVGQRVSGLEDSGLYRYTRNPQIVAYLMIVVGYALLWPSLAGALWSAVYVLIAHVMVRTEEEHLARVYGDDYRRYCERTPRYIGIPRKPPSGDSPMDKR